MKLNYKCCKCGKITTVSLNNGRWNPYKQNIEHCEPTPEFPDYYRHMWEFTFNPEESTEDQIHIYSRMSSLSNLELYESVLQLSEPDDYDGDFTTLGVFERDCAKKEIEKRLENWLKG